MRKITAICTGPYTHLDHFAPLCKILNIPLIITEPDIWELSKKFYPMIESVYIPMNELNLEKIADFDLIIQSCKFGAKQLKSLVNLLFNKEIRVIYTPHGNSDKESFLKGDIDQDIELIYGPQMKRAKNRANFIEIGNIRKNFYIQHKEHFDYLAKPYFQKKKTVLYAPTWESKATTTSFFEAMDQIVESCSDDYHILVKPHPLLENNDPARFYYILDKYASKVQFVLNFPAIYPLLEKTDIYLGDYSSIGYDFLAYNRPMFFLKEGGQLQKAGRIFKGDLNDRQKDLEKVREELYFDAFGENVDPKKVKALILKKSELQTFTLE